MTDEQMRHEIMLVMQANQLRVQADVWFSLIFSSTEALQNICRELGVDFKKKAN